MLLVFRQWRCPGRAQQAMKPLFQLTIPMRPQQKERHRSTKRGKIYTPEKTRRAEAFIGDQCLLCLLSASQGIGPHVFPPPDAPLQLVCHFVYATKTKKKWGKYKVSKPDLSNLVKLVEDALNGVVYHDDSQIASYGNSTKRWGEKDSVSFALYILEEK